MSDIVEIDERGAIHLPHAVLAVMKPHTRFVLDVQGNILLLRPITTMPFWQTATPQERAEAARQWAELPRPAAPAIPDAVLHRDQMYD